MAGHGDPISVLPAAGPLTGAELLVTVQDGETRQFAVVRLLPPSPPPPPPPSSFSGARLTGGGLVPPAGGGTVPFDTVIYDTEDYAAAADGTFTIPASGIYRLSATLDLDGLDPGDALLVQISGGGVVGESCCPVESFIGLRSCATGASSFTAGDVVGCNIGWNGTDGLVTGSFDIERLYLSALPPPPPPPVRHSLAFGPAGTGDVDLADALGTSDSFTWTGWVRFDALPGSGPVMVMHRGEDGFGDGWSVNLTVDDAGLISLGVVMTVPAVTGTNLSYSPPVTAGTWFFLAVTCAGDDGLSIYVNGPLASNVALASRTLRTSTDGWHVGGVFLGTFPPLNGLIADPAWWSRVLTPLEIGTLADPAFHPSDVPAGLLSYYPVYEAAGTTLANAVGGGPAATLSGDVSISLTVPPGF